VKALPVEFFERRADLVARELLGAPIRSRLGGRLTEGLIVETEAYLGFDDPASHGYRGRLHDGNRNLYAPPGTWYVYRSYGIHWCANLVCGGPESGSAVLLRAVFPRSGIELMRRRRGGVADAMLANGPGKLCQALAITRELDGTPMRRSGVRVYAPESTIPIRVVVTPRIGISKAVDWPLRFLSTLRPEPLPGRRREKSAARP
jgi:DNA-3-methyladenine glycosylase